MKEPLRRIAFRIQRTPPCDEFQSSRGRLTAKLSVAALLPQTDERTAAIVRDL